AQQTERLGNAARNRPENAGARPEHAFESVTTTDAVFVVVVIFRHVVFTPGGRPSMGQTSERPRERATYSRVAKIKKRSSEAGFEEAPRADRDRRAAPCAPRAPHRNT